MIKEIEDNKTNGKILCAHGLEESILLKWLHYPKKSRDSVQSHKNTNGIYHRARTNNSKICMNTQKTPNSQNNLGKEEQS